MSRITMTDSGQAVCIKMSEGNPSALHVVVACIEKGEAIDPQSLLGGLGAVLSLDALGIYGARIWLLYKDVCRENLHDMVAILRACQLGFLAEGKLRHAIDNRGGGLDVPALVAQVEQRLPKFQKQSAAPAANEDNPSRPEDASGGTSDPRPSPEPLG